MNGSGHLWYKIPIETIGCMDGVEKFLNLFEIKRDKDKKTEYAFRSFKSLGPFDFWRSNSPILFQRLLDLSGDSYQDLGKTNVQTCWRRPDGSILFVVDCYAIPSKEELNTYFIVKVAIARLSHFMFSTMNLSVTVIIGSISKREISTARHSWSPSLNGIIRYQLQ